MRADADPPEVIIITGNGTIETAISAHEARRLRLHGEAVPHGGDRRARAPRVGEAPARARERAAAVAARARAAARAEIVTQYAPLAGGARRSSRAWRRATRRCSSPASRARARSSSRSMLHRLSAARAARSSTSTARRSAKACSRASCSATSAARSPAPTSASSASWSSPPAARCSSTRSASSSPKLQGKLLRALEQRQLLSAWAARRRSRSTCASSPPPTATSRARVARRAFRDDLLYRVNAIAIELPPLRERAVDIPLLARQFLEQFGRRTPPTLTAGRARRARAVSVARQRARAAQRHRARGAARAGAADPRAATCRSRLPGRRAPPRVVARAMLTLAELERRHIEAVLHNTQLASGSRRAALGISSKTLYRKIREYGFRRARAAME